MLHRDTAGPRPHLRTRFYTSIMLFMILALLFVDFPVSIQVLPQTATVHAQTLLGDFGDIWASIELDDSHDLAWGDMDNDGDLDLAVANRGDVPGRIYRNDNGELESFWESPHSYKSQAVAWGDYDNDGDLDLILSNSDSYGLAAYTGLYRNEGGTFTPDLSWTPYELYAPTSLIWGDIDGDSDLDLVTGSDSADAQLYLNNNGTLSNTSAWRSTNFIGVTDVALGDLDNDSDLDLVVSSTTFPTSFYRNEGGSFSLSPTLTLADGVTADSIDLGDYDADGDLDLLTTEYSNGAHVYHSYQVEQHTTNFATIFADSPVWSSGDTAITDAVWGDYDNDGDLDIGVARSYGKNLVFRNDGRDNDSTDTFTTTWQAPGLDSTNRVAWADVNGDGVLDFASVNSGQPNRVAFNNDGGSTEGMVGDGGLLPYNGTPLTPEEAMTEVVVLADYDNDGDLDLTVGNHFETPSEIYRNDEGTFTESPVWSSRDNEDTYDIDWIDYDNDGDLDLAAINYQQIDYLYRNDGVDDQGQPILTPFPLYDIENTALAGAWADYDNDGDLDLAVANSRNWSYDGDYWYGDLEANHVYRNDGSDASGAPIFTQAWQSEGEKELSYDIEWGDIDQDGDADLVVANEGHPNRIYRNDNGVLTESPVWSSRRHTRTSSVALGDYDNDGDLDLAFGNRYEPNTVYGNEQGSISDTPVWESSSSKIAYDITWADYDNDGDLDLLVGNNDDGVGTGHGNFLYRNENGTLNEIEIWQDYDADYVTSATWGDIDNDSDLDLVTGSRQGASVLLYRNRLYDRIAGNHPAQVSINEGADGASLHTHVNEEPVIPIEYTLTDPEGEGVSQIRAYYSMDGAGHWLPAIASSDTVTHNLETAHEVTTYQTSPQTAAATASQNIPDGATLSTDLDFSTAGTLANLEPELTISHSRSSQLSAELRAAWPANAETTVRLFDDLVVDGPDPVTVRFSDAAAGPLPEGESGGGEATTSYTSSDVSKNIPDRGSVTSVLNVPNGGTILDVDVIDLHGTHTYLRDLRFKLRSPSGTKITIINRPCRWQNNFNLSLDDEADDDDWPCPPTDGGTYNPYETLSAFDGEDSAGTWKLIVSDHGRSDTGRLNGWGLRITTDGGTVSGPLLDNGTYLPADSLAAFDGMPADTPLTLHITDEASGKSGALDAWSLDVQVTTEETSMASDGKHTFYWDTFASGFFGQSDNVVFRIEALPDPRPMPNSVSRSYSYGHTADQTQPFSVRGTQVRVIDQQGAPVTDAIVYQLPAGQEQGGDLMINGGSVTFTTDSQGYLQGRGKLAIGDRLLALALVEVADTYMLYHTNGTPSELGVDTVSVENPGVQTLTVSADNPLILFDITIALEWDASSDPAYLQQLEFNIKRASQYLYDFTNGQMALGDVMVTQNADEWAYAEVVVQANNSLRPWANQGGIVLTPTVDLEHPDIVYDTGQVVMGSTWNRYGEPGTNMGDDWAIVLAHELSHYVLFLDDAYVGLTDDDLLTPVDTCQGTAMGDPYTDQNNSEFIWDDVYWQANCADTLTNQTLQRNEWETISMWYPELNVPTATNTGPGLMPFSLTSVQLYEPITRTNALEDPTFYLDYIGNGIASNQAQVYLQRNLDDDDIYDYVVPMGGPLGGQNRIKAHGAQPGDRLCAFDPEHQYFGCEVIETGDDRLSLQRDESWLPVLQLTPVTSTTFDIEVSNVPAGLSLKAQLYPELGSSYEAIDLAWDGTHYTGNFLTELPEMAGHIAVWVDEPATEEEPRREAMVSYSVGGNPGSSRKNRIDLRGGGGSSRKNRIDLRGGGGSSRKNRIDLRGGGGSSRKNRIDLRGGGGSSRKNRAPVMSADGQMTFFTANPVVFPEGEFYTIQTMAGLPDVPPGRTVIGQGYNLITTDGAPDLDGSISFEYLTGDVRTEGIQENAEVDDLKIYFWDGTTWEMLDTKVNAYYNFVSAAGRGAGVYALMSSTEIALYTPGWNLIAYPIRGAHPVNEALRSIEGFYTQVYGFEPDGQSDPWTSYIAGDSESPWKRYDVSMPAWANTLTHLEFGRGYWLNVNGAPTLFLGDDTVTSASFTSGIGVQQVNLPPPPATYYGTVAPQEGFTPEAGLELLAKMDGIVCGRTLTQEFDGQIVYVVDVLATGTGPSAGCGAPGSRVTFEVSGVTLGTTAVWDNTQSRELQLSLTPAASQTIYLPLVNK